MSSLITIRPELLSLTQQQMSALGPFFLVFLGAIVAIILSVSRVLGIRRSVFLVTILTSVAGITSAALLFDRGPVILFNSMLVVDSFSCFFFMLFLGSVALTVLASIRYLDDEQLQYPEYYVLMLFSAIGMMLMVSALDLIVLFIALEIMSLAVYVLVGFRRADRRSNEAALKYFILGGAASAILLYGAALLYGATGTTGIRGILEFIKTQPGAMTPVFALGALLVILGFLFKVAAVPFHMWMPDVYEGAPAPVTGFMTTGLKAAAFAAFLRVLVSFGYGSALTEVIQKHIHDILWVSAVLTMALGNVIALTQTNLKRMLAYSSIAHTGYILVGILAGAGNEQGYASVVLYLAVYAIMNLGAFVVLVIAAKKADSGLNLHDFSGLSSRHPWLAFAMAVFILSMAGIPPTAGFYAKYLLFFSAIQAGETWLVVISVLCSAVSVYYYLRVLVYMYMRDPSGQPVELRMSMWSTLAVSAMVALTIQIGILPARAVTAAKRAISSL